MKDKASKSLFGIFTVLICCIIALGISPSVSVEAASSCAGCGKTKAKCTCSGGYHTSHSYGSWYDGGSSCTKKCSKCSATSTQSHSYGSYYGQTHSSGWNHTATKKCGTCGHTYTGTFSCTQSTSGCTTSCTKCGYSETNHTQSGLKRSYAGSGQHYYWRDCTKCGALVGYSSTTSKKAACTTATKISGCTEITYCTVCNGTISQTLKHDYATAWQKDGTNHWQKCNNCTATGNKATHAYTYTSKDNSNHTVTCKTCGYSKSEAHTFSGTKCTKCDYVKEVGGNSSGKCKTNVCYIRGDTSQWGACECAGADFAGTISSGCVYTMDGTGDASISISLKVGTDGTIKEASCSKKGAFATKTVCHGHNITSITNFNVYWTSNKAPTATKVTSNSLLCYWTATAKATGKYSVSCRTCNTEHVRVFEKTSTWDLAQMTVAAINGRASCTFPSTWSQYDDTRHCMKCTSNSSHIKYQDHTFGGWTKADATTHKRTCSVCGYVQKQNHSWTTTATGTAYTDKNASVHTRTDSRKCSVCSATDTVKVDEAHNSSKTRSGSVDGTSWSYNSSQHWKTRTPYTYYDCSKCGRINTGTAKAGSPTQISTGYHSFSSWVSTGSSQHSRTCSVCGYTEYGSHNKTESSRYSSDGTSWSYNSSQHWKTRSYTIYYRCSVCGYSGYGTGSDSTSINTANHSFSAWTSIDGSSHRRSCSVCGYVQTENHNKTAQAGTYTDAPSWSYNATQHWKVRTTTTPYKCSVCNYSGYPSTTGNSNVDTANHSWQAVTYGAWATTGSTQHKRDVVWKCTVCGYSETRIETQNHTMSTTYTEWTKTDDTSHKRTRTDKCTVCGQVNTSPETGAHSWSIIKITDPASKSDTQHFVTYTYQCALCKATKTESMNENHKFIKTSTNWGITTGNVSMSKLYTCSVCGGNHRTHVNTSDTTANHYRVSSYKCSVCGSGYEEIETQTHTKSYTPVNSSVHLVKCVPCGKSFGNEAHSFTYTDNHNGYITKKCTKCGYTEDNPIDYTLSLDRNLGTCTTSVQALKYDVPFVLPDCTRSGYIFRGWQVYSGSTLYTNSTDTLSATAKVFPSGTAVSKLTTENGTTVKLVAVWQKSDAVVNYSPVTLSGNIINTKISGNTRTYIAKAGSTYRPSFGLTFKGLPYYRLSSVKLDVKGVSKPEGYKRTDNTLSGEYVKETKITPELSVSGNDGEHITAVFGYGYVNDWYDSYHTKDSAEKTVSSSAEIYFDGKSPVLVSPSFEAMKAKYEEIGNSTGLNGTVLNFNASDVFGSTYSGLADGSYIKIYNQKNNLTKTLTKTPVTSNDSTFGLRTDSYTFESVTVGTTGLFEEGFTVIVHLVDRLGNTYDSTDSFSNFDIKLEDIGSYTYDRSTHSFVNGEAVYVRIKTSGDVEKYVLEFVPETEAETFGSVGKDYSTLKHTVTSEFLTRSTKITTVVGTPESDGYDIFIIPLDSTKSSYTVRITGYKGTSFKSVTDTITVDNSKEIIKPIITIIE